MASARPFDFSKLPKISSQEAKLLKDLQLFSPRIDSTKNLGQAVQILIARELGSSFSLAVERIASVSVAQKLQEFPRQGVYVVIGLEPLEQKAVLELDPLITHMAVDRLLGGKGELLTAVRPLTEVEEGVLSYLVLKILALIYERGKSEKVHFRLEGIASSSDEILKKIRPEDPGIMISCRLRLDSQTGYARLILPSPLAQKAFLESPGLSKEEGVDACARLSRLGFLGTSLWAELGRTTLNVGEINHLEPGDVVLLENSRAHSEGGQLKGSLSLRVGRGEKSLRGEIVSNTGPLMVRLGT